MPEKLYLLERFPGKRGDPPTPETPDPAYQLLTSKQLTEIMVQAIDNKQRIAVFEVGEQLLDWT